MSLDLRIKLEADALVNGVYKGARRLFYGKPHGYGSIRSKDLLYVGDFKHGMYHGIGTIKYADGALYQG